MPDSNHIPPSSASGRPETTLIRLRDLNTVAEAPHEEEPPDLPACPTVWRAVTSTMRFHHSHFGGLGHGPGFRLRGGNSPVVRCQW